MPGVKKSPPKQAEPSNTEVLKRLNEVYDKLDETIARVDAFEEQREEHTPGRKKMPLLRPNEPGVCAFDPDCNSKECKIASTYRYQQLCRGTACVIKARQQQRETRGKGK